MLMAVGAIGTAMATASRPVHAQRLPERDLNRLAEDHFRRGSEAFRTGHYASAVQEFQAVYQMTSQPEMLFNLARVYEAAGAFDAAIQTYEAFLEHGAPSIGPDQVREWIAALRVRQSAGSSASPVPSSAPPRPNNGSLPPDCPAPTAAAPSIPIASPLLQLRIMRVEYRRTPVNEFGPFVVGGVGLVIGAFGAWQAFAAQQDVALYNQANTGAITWGRDAQRAHDAAPGEFVAAYTLGAVGGALLLTGAGWLIFRGRGERREVIEAAASPLPGGFVLALGGRW